MTFALDPETPTDVLKDLIVSDIAPVRAKASADTVTHIQGMEEIEASNVSSRKVANEILEKFEKVTFLLTCHPAVPNWRSRTQASAHFY